jgi:hypothetical protein
MQAFLRKCCLCVVDNKLFLPMRKIKEGPSGDPSFVSVHHVCVAPIPLFITNWQVQFFLDFL